MLRVLRIVFFFDDSSYYILYGTCWCEIWDYDLGRKTGNLPKIKKIWISFISDAILILDDVCLRESDIGQNTQENTIKEPNPRGKPSVVGAS